METRDHGSHKTGVVKAKHMQKPIIALVCGVFFASAGIATGANDPKEEQAVIATLEAMAQATVSKNIAALERIFHDDMSYAHTDGDTQTKAQVLQVVRERTWESMRFSGMTVRIIGSLALARGFMEVRNQTKTGGTNSAPKGWGTLNQARVPVLWVLTKGPGPQGWQVVARQPFRPGATPAAQPPAAR